jgi:hypothetical protein
MNCLGGEFEIKNNYLINESPLDKNIIDFFESNNKSNAKRNSLR